MKDQRIKLLEKLNSTGFSTSEFDANEFLTTFNGDLGTVRRMLIELIDFDLIRESNVEKNDFGKSIIRNIDTERGSIEKKIPQTIEKKNKLRLIKPVTFELNGEQKTYPQIKPIRIFITIKGQQFLIENEKLNIDLTLSKWNKIWFWIIALISIAGLGLSILSLAKSQ